MHLISSRLWIKLQLRRITDRKVGFCEHDNELFGSIKAAKFLYIWETINFIEISRVVLDTNNEMRKQYFLYS